MRTAPPKAPGSVPVQWNGETERLPRVFEIEEKGLELAVKEVGAAVEEDRRGRLESCYRIGRLVRKHYRRQQEKDGGIHWLDRGEHFLKQLAEALELPAGWLRERFSLVSQCDEDAFEEFCQTLGMTATEAIRLATDPLEPPNGNLPTWN